MDESESSASSIFTEDPQRDMTDGTPVPSSPPDNVKPNDNENEKQAQNVEDMSAEARLQRIKYLVDQSKLYATFLTSNLPESKADAAPTDSSSEPSEQSETVMKSLAAPASTAKGKQRTLRSFFKPASKEEAQLSQTRAVEKAAAAAGFQAPKSVVAKMHPHQVIGVEWMVTLFQNGLNGILADEMGLGKTLQVIAFLAYLQEQSIPGPFLIVAPLSTLANWKNEFTNFCPDLKAEQYYGSKDARTKLRRKLLARGRPAVPVIITTYEIVMQDARFLRDVDWKYIIVDEGHRLKNVECRLMRELKQYSSANRMLLTGTPLQNNLTELWALLNFLLPDVFTDLEIFHTWFESGEAKIDEDNESGLVTSLHSILRPFLLRRLKSEVHLKLPDKREYVIFTGLTQDQTDLYQNILHGTARDYVVSKILEERGYDAPSESPRETSGRSKRRRITYAEPGSDEELDSDASSDSTAQTPKPTPNDSDSSMTDLMVKQAHQELRSKRFQNMMMQLRLACDSPYLFYYPWTTEPVDERLVSTSGKLRMLDALMKRLHKQGHKVLIFSQFTKMLDLLEDWARLRAYNFSRIDGSTSQEERAELMKEFEGQSDIDLFLLSTRSGGQGVNLVAADTVIIFDSDWNPHQDLQAMDRVHRIGQTKPVLVFRLITGDTIEQVLLEKAAAKLELGNIVIEKGRFRGIGVTQQEQIASMDKQLQVHKMKYSGDVTVSEREFKQMLDRSPKGYAAARDTPKLAENIYLR